MIEDTADRIRLVEEKIKQAKETHLVCDELIKVWQQHVQYHKDCIIGMGYMLSQLEQNKESQEGS